MNKLLIALLAGTLASVAAAQTSSPSLTRMEKQDAVSAAGARGSDSATANESAAMREARARAQQDVAKMTLEEKQAFFDMLRDSNVNPNNPTGSAGTAVMQQKNTAAAQGVAKNRPDLGTPAAGKALEKASTR